MKLTELERDIAAERRGSRTSLPIVEISDINKIKHRVRKNKKHTALLTLGLNTALRGVDLVRLRVRDVHPIDAQDSFTITERKTMKRITLTLNQPTVDAIQDLVESQNLRPDDYLFQGQRRGPHSISDPVPHLTRQALSSLVRIWCRDLGLLGSYGSHTLRKTRVFHLYQNGTDLGLLMLLLNHSSAAQTLKYICAQPKDMADLSKLEL